MKIFTLIPKASATEIAVFENDEAIFSKTIAHVPSEFAALRTPPEQGQYRFNAIIEAVTASDFDMKDVGVVITEIASRRLPAGIYMIDDSITAILAENMIDENQHRSGVFAALLVSRHIGGNHDVECMPLVVEPIIISEIMPEAAISGLKGITREPVCNTLSHRTAASHYSHYEKGSGLNDARVVAVHLGNEISVGAYDMGRLLDSNSPQDGEGPFSPFTSGTLPANSLIDLCYSGRYDMDETLRIISSESGLSAYLDDASLPAVMKAYRAGHRKTIFMVKAMAYKTAREIGAKAAALSGSVEAILLTGPWAVFEEFTREISSRVEWIAPVRNYALEGEMKQLARAAAEVYKGNVKIKLYGLDC
ncbi:MAG: butyrate kinase [Synergistaceae bacterium]|nr:butyrate kinase [Synergistaceae bacterium]